MLAGSALKWNENARKLYIHCLRHTVHLVLTIQSPNADTDPMQEGTKVLKKRVGLSS